MVFGVTTFYSIVDLVLFNSQYTTLEYNNLQRNFYTSSSYGNNSNNNNNLCNRLNYTRERLYNIRRKSKSVKPNYDILSNLKDLNVLYFRGCRGGTRKKRTISVKITHRLPDTNNLTYTHFKPYRPRVLANFPINPKLIDSPGQRSTFKPVASSTLARYPVILLINPTSLAKPHALQHLQADILSHDVDIAAVTESWLKSHHLDQNFTVQGYNLYRLDRLKRKGGGVCLYIRASFSDIQLLNLNNVCGYNSLFELLFVKLKLSDNSIFLVGVLYHPPKPLYYTADLLCYLDNILTYLINSYPDMCVALCGDFNQLLDSDLTNLGLINLVNEPTHKGHKLDRIYVSNPVYDNTIIFKSSIFTEHSAVLTVSNNNCIRTNLVVNDRKTTVRLKTPSRHASLLNDLQSYDWSDVIITNDTQLAGFEILNKYLGGSWLNWC